MTEGSNEVVEMFTAWRNGDAEAGEQLFQLLYDDLSGIASALLRREREDISLVTGDLVHETIARLLRTDDFTANDRAHFLNLCAKVMKQVLTDSARRRDRHKRKGVKVTLSSSEEDFGVVELDLLALDHAMRRLRAIDPSRADIVEMRYFGGMTLEEIASLQGVSRETVKRVWAAARLWLEEAIKNDI